MAYNDILSGFRVQSNEAIDSRLVSATLIDRDAIPAAARYEGLQTYSQEDAKIYVLSGGIENTNWVELSTLAGASDTREELLVKLDGAYMLDNPNLMTETKEALQGYYGLLSGFYFSGTATDAVIPVSSIDTWIDAEMTVDAQGSFDNRPTAMKDALAAGHTGTGASGDPIIFCLEGLTTTAFANFRASMSFTPDEDEGRLETRLLFNRHTGTTPSDDFTIEEVSLTMQDGADVVYTTEPMLSFFVGDTIDTNGVGDAGKVRFQIKSSVAGTVSMRALTFYLNK